MFRQISMVVLLLSFWFGGFSANANDQHQFNEYGSYEEADRLNSFGGDEDIWPYVVVDLWKNIEGLWSWRRGNEIEIYRFEIKQKFSDGTMAIKVDVIDPSSGKVMASHMSLGAARNIELRTVIRGNGFDHFLKVKAYDKNRIQCRQACGKIRILKDQNIVLGLVLTPTDGSSRHKEFRLLRKIGEL